jgi:outer membrane protein OmpA-like peptidoglycan-associated protein
MTTNLLSMAQQALGGDFAKMAGQFLGESPDATQSALGSLLPAVIGGVARSGATPDGASKLLSLVNGANLDTTQLGNLAGLFGGGGGAANALMKAGTASLVPALFGDRSGALVNALSSAAGIKSNSATNLIAMVVPLIFMLLKKFIGEKGLNANSLATLLSSQGPALQGALDSRLTSALGFANPAAFLSGLGGQAADAALRAGSAVAAGTAATATAAKSGLMRWLPWLIGAAVLLFLWNLFTNKPAAPPTPAPAPKAQVTPAPAPAPAPVPAPVAAGFPVKVYFEVSSAALRPDGTSAITAAAEVIKKDGAKAAVTGYTDRTGDAAKNQELAKERAKAVRDALVAGGVPEGNVEMRPPMFVETGAAGSDAEARRVEITR